MNEEDAYEQKMEVSVSRRKAIASEINNLLAEYKKLEAQEDEWDSEEFARTGAITYTLNIDIEITEEDLLRDLVKRTEGNNIKIEKSEDN